MLSVCTSLVGIQTVMDIPGAHSHCTFMAISNGSQATFSGKMQV